MDRPLVDSLAEEHSSTLLADAATDSERGRVPAQWIDYNGHMVDSAYCVAFSDAASRLLDQLGIGRAYLRDGGNTMYTAEMHVSFVNEMSLGQEFACASIVLGVDSKRLHVLQTLTGYPATEPAATCELLLLHVNRVKRKVEPFPPDVLARLLAACVSEASLPRGRTRQTRRLCLALGAKSDSSNMEGR
jgi:acyl-CoA thioester hydrolase